MKETVFENQECADILNEHFVSIKVGREERLDIDKHYQEVYNTVQMTAQAYSKQFIYNTYLLFFNLILFD